MSTLLRPMSYILVIVLGTVLRHTGFFGPEDHRTLSRVMINITLPCTIVQAFSGFTHDRSLFVIVLYGFVCALVPMLIMYLLTGRTDKRLRIYRMLNVGGYNIGCFSLPLIEIFFGGTGVVAACLFDTGNAIMMTGGSYALTTGLLHLEGEKRPGIGSTLLKFVSSVPFDTYMLMFLLVLLDVPVPEPVFVLTRPAGQANGFLAMLMIGAMFEPKGDLGQLKIALQEVGTRILLCALFSMLLYRFAPFSLTIRRTLAVVALAPLSSLAPLYTDRCGGDTAMASLTNSLSIFCSLVLMMALGLRMTL